MKDPMMKKKRLFAMQFTIKHLMFALVFVALLCSWVLWLDLNSEQRRMDRLERVKSGDTHLLAFARENLHAKESSVRLAAAGAVGKIGYCDDQVLDELIETLQSDPIASPNAAWAIGNLMPASNRAIDALIKALENKNHETRRLAAFSLARYGTLATVAIPSLERHLDDFNSACMGARALGEMAQYVPKSSIDKITAMLRSEEPGDRGEACMALAKISAWHQLDPSTVDAIELISRNDSVEFIRGYAKTSIEDIRLNLKLQSPLETSAQK